MFENRRDKTQILVMLLLFKENFRGKFEFQKNQSVQDQGFPQRLFYNKGIPIALGNNSEVPGFTISIVSV